MENSSRISPSGSKLFFIDLFLRVLLMASSLAATVFMRTGKQTVTERTTIPNAFLNVYLDVRWSYSPAFIYFLSGLSFATTYGGITALNIICRGRQSLSNVILLFMTLLDALTLGIVASATGAVSAVAYIALKGNEYMGWEEYCSTFDKFCKHIGISAALSLFASVLLSLLLMLNAYSLYRQIQRRS